jgi:3-deoxy-D-manno-octulosonic-acid transferase
MPYLLNLFYSLLLLFLSPWLLYKALTTGKYRRGLWQKLTGRAFLRTGTTPCVWFHGVSVGEVHLLRQVVAEFRRRHPGWECVISTTTDTGYEEACKRFPDLTVFYWPLDFTWAVRRALRRVKPNLVVLAEGELWPNFLCAAERQKVPVAVINGRMSPRSFRRYRRLGPLLRSVFRRMKLWAVQTQEYADHVIALGAAPETVVVTGNVKYDGVLTDRNNPKTSELRRLLSVGANDLVWIAGSTQAPEEAIVLDIFRRLRPEYPTLRLLLVPRQRERFDEVAGLLERSSEPFVRRSKIESACPAVVLVDTIGELGALWGLADVAFVGGSLDGKRGGQNMIEPAAYGAAVVFGPHVWNFRETAKRLVGARAAVQIADAGELERALRQILSDVAGREEMGTAARRFVLEQRGATERTVVRLEKLMRNGAGQSMAA